MIQELIKQKKLELKILELQLMELRSQERTLSNVSNIALTTGRVIEIRKIINQLKEVE